MESRFLDLKFNSDKIDQVDKIKINKFYSEIKNYAKKHKKSDRCILCGAKQTSFCKSHTIPQFILKNVAVNGLVKTGFSIHGGSIYKNDYGIADCLCFNCICKKCDNERFQNYEDSKFIAQGNGSDFLKSIALKCALRMYDKRSEDYYKSAKLSLSDGFGDSDERSKIAFLDIAGYLKTIQEINKNSFYLIDKIELDYMTPIAFQNSINVVSDFDGNVVNDIYNDDPNYLIQDLYISVFPEDGKTFIYLFIKDGDLRYRKFYKKYRTLNLDEKLYVINFLILAYSEEWVINPNYAKIINKEAHKIITFNNEQEFFNNTPFFNKEEIHKSALRNALIKFKIPTTGNITNLLKVRME